MSIFKKLFHKQDTEADERLERELRANDRKRKEMHRRITAIEATLPVRQKKGTQ